MKRLFISALICLIALPHAAHAQLIQRACGGYMPCTFEQFKAGELTWYQRADINHDGIIDANEQQAVWANFAQDILPACGGMQDVKVLKLTHMPTDEQIHKTFASVDTNSDGVIDAQEDQQATAMINQTCQLMRDPQMRKLQQLFKQYQQH